MAKIDRIPDTKQQWFKDAKYGLFIHWGLYAILAGEWNGKKTDHISEWIMNSLNIPVSEYEKLAAQFDPVKFDADALVKHAKEVWGMKYIVFTSKHHDGFAMYHSDCNKYNSVDATPSKRDIVKELSDACKKYDMKLGLYYSQAQDWHDPNGYVSPVAGLEGHVAPDNKKKDFQYYLDNKVKPQLKEILTKYGDICLIWFDTPMEMTKQQSQECIDLVKSIQPNCIISGRVGNQLGDYMTTGDNFLPRIPFEGDWEDPATVNDTWGYNKDDHRWKSPENILKILLKIVSRGGNYLLNIGPRADGTVPEKCSEILDTVGKYVVANGEGIYGTKRMEFYPYDTLWGEMTGKDNKIFLHVLEPTKRLELMNCKATPKKAYVLGNGRALRCWAASNCEGDSRLEVELPEDLRDSKNFCVCVEIEEKSPTFEPLRG